VATIVGRGDAALVALVVALVAAFGVGSGRALFALASDETTGLHEDVRALSRPWLVTAVLAGAAVGVPLVRRVDGGLWSLAVLVTAGLAALVVGAGLRSEGTVDPAEGTVEYDGRTIPLGAVRQVYSWTVGPFVLLVVRYHRGHVGPSTPRLLVVSAAALDAVESARRSASTGTTPDAGARAAPTAVRVVAAVFGLASLAVGPALWLLLPPGAGRPVAAYLGVFGLLFGALFLRYALVA
jgi:hypothetical protein